MELNNKIHLMKLKQQAIREMNIKHEPIRPAKMQASLDQMY